MYNTRELSLLDSLVLLSGSILYLSRIKQGVRELEVIEDGSSGL